MNKQQLLDTINSSLVSNDIKQELVKIVERAPQYNDDVVRAVKARLDTHAENILERVANLELQEAAATFEHEVEAIEKDADKLNRDIQKQADEIDTAEARAKIGAG